MDDNNCLTLHLKQCSGIAKTSLKVKEAAPIPCTLCANLQNHAMILGIWHWVLDGAHKNTPWSFLSMGQMLSLLWCNTHTINWLKLQVLIGVQNRHCGSDYLWLLGTRIFLAYGASWQLNFELVPVSLLCSRRYIRQLIVYTAHVVTRLLTSNVPI